jgi:hypothetical protein
MSDTDKNTDTDKSTPDSIDNSTPESINKSLQDSIDKSILDSIDNSIQLNDITVDVKLSDITGNLLTTSNMFMLLWFLAIYIVMYYVLGMFFNKGTEPGEFQQNLGRMLDFIFFISVVVFII